MRFATGLGLAILGAFSAGAQAPTPEYLRANNNLAHENLICAAYYAAVHACLGERDKELKERYEKVGVVFLERAKIHTQEAKLLETTIAARLKMASEDMTKAIGGQCQNISVLLATYGNSCKFLVEQPLARAKQLIDAEFNKK
ncbi:MAG: hypothetical protein KF794_08990 [Xanthobacteraceae bacterium]|nr:hypothetical protein [Xanthobacteraceae bacterium]QYK43937.1 MAG: hypothetical protein KF794_08990 [Xanthobacteraceae bacterium]